MYLTELALDFAQQVLKPGGNFVVKVFEGEGLDDFRNAARKIFSKVLNRKPKASRDESRELYIVGKGKLK
jgi:23S rRNA (uridine2552-2'-O)-methyltransferase